MPRSPDPWSVIESLAETPATLYEWRWRLGPFFDASAAFLRPVEPPSELYVPCQACRAPVPAFRESSGFYQASHDMGSPCKHAASIEAPEMGSYLLDTSALGAHLAELLHLVRPSPEDFAAAPALIGYVARPVRMPVFLNIRSDTDSYRSAGLAILAQRAPPFILLSPTPREALRQSFSPLGIHILDAAAFSEWTPNELRSTGNSLETELAINIAGLATSRTPPFSLIRGADCWIVTFEGQSFPVADQMGMDYVSYLLRNPPSEPMHALTLAASAELRPADSLSTVTDSNTGQQIAVEAGATLQQLNLSRDDQNRLVNLRRRYGSLMKELDDPQLTETERNEAEIELEKVNSEMHSITRTTRDETAKKTDAMRRSIKRLCDKLRSIPSSESTAKPASRFADFIETQITNPSTRFGRTLRSKQAGHAAGCFIYEPPPGVVWI